MDYKTIAIKSTSGTIGKLAIDGDGLSYGSTFKIDPTVDSWGSSEKQKATVVASSTLVQNTLVLPGQSKRYHDEVSYYWPAFDREGLKILYTADWTGTDKPYKLGEYDLWDLAGIPIVIDNNMPDYTTGNRAIVLANIADAYSINMLQDIVVRRLDQIEFTKGVEVFAGYLMADGKITNQDALKVAVVGAGRAKASK